MLEVCAGYDFSLEGSISSISLYRTIVLPSPKKSLRILKLASLFPLLSTLKRQQLKNLSLFFCLGMTSSPCKNCSTSDIDNFSSLFESNSKSKSINGFYVLLNCYRASSMMFASTAKQISSIKSFISMGVFSNLSLGTLVT